MKHLFFTLFAALLSITLYGESLLVTLPPQVECVQSISGSLYQVHSLVPQGSIPENYIVTPRQLVSYKDCRVFFTIGIPLETRLNKKLHSIYPALRLVDGRKGMKLRTMGTHHHHGNTDPHVWLSIENMKTFADTVCKELSRVAPQHKAVFEQNKNNYIEKLNALQTEITTLLTPFKGQTILVNHPAFGYICDTFALRQISVEKDGKEASAQHLAELTSQIQNMQHKVLFVQPQFNQKTCKELAQRHHLKIVILNPLPAPYLQGMRDITSVLSKELKSN